MADSEESLDLQARKREAKIYFAKKNLKTVEVGQKVDVRNPEYIWCVGIIKKISYRQENNCKILFIHYEVGPSFPFWIFPNSRVFPMSMTRQSLISLHAWRVRVSTPAETVISLFVDLRYSEDGVGRGGRESNHPQREENTLLLPRELQQGRATHGTGGLGRREIRSVRE